MNLRTEFEAYLDEYYLGSSLSNEFGEIAYHPTLKRCISPYLLTNFEEEYEFCAKVFRETFPSRDQEIVTFISSWDVIPNIITECFSDQSNSFTWLTDIEFTDTQRTKGLWKTELAEIDYTKLLRILLNSEINVDPQANIRIYFFNQKTHRVYHYWDSMLEVGAPEEAKTTEPRSEPGLESNTFTMEELISIMENYIAWSHLWHRLHDSHSNEDLNGLMLKVKVAEQTILTHFGLPFTFKYSDLFQTLGLKDNFNLIDIITFLDELKDEAEKYLTGPILTDLKLLEEAQRNNWDIDDVLPELSYKLKPEPYYFFIYERYFQKKLVRPEDFLEELRIINDFDLSLRLNFLSRDNTLILQEDYKELWSYDLRFFQQFLDEYQT